MYANIDFSNMDGSKYNCTIEYVQEYCGLVSLWVVVQNVSLKID